MNYTHRKRGFGGNAPNKLMASAEGKGSELVSDLCHRHGQKLVLNIQERASKKERRGWLALAKNRWEIITCHGNLCQQLVSSCMLAHAALVNIPEKEGWLSQLTMLALPDKKGRYW